MLLEKWKKPLFLLLLFFSIVLFIVVFFVVFAETVASNDGIGSPRWTNHDSRRSLDSYAIASSSALATPSAKAHGQAGLYKQVLLTDKSNGGHNDSRTVEIVQSCGPHASDGPFSCPASPLLHVRAHNSFCSITVQPPAHRTQLL